MTIDFSKIKMPTPEESEANRQKILAKIKAKEDSQRRMIAYLHDEAEGLTAWEQEFVESLRRRALDPNFFHLTDKQDKILTDLFEKH